MEEPASSQHVRRHTQARQRKRHTKNVTRHQLLGKTGDDNDIYNNV